MKPVSVKHSFHIMPRRETFVSKKRRGAVKLPLLHYFGAIVSGRETEKHAARSEHNSPQSSHSVLCPLESCLGFGIESFRLLGQFL